MAGFAYRFADFLFDPDRSRLYRETPDGLVAVPLGGRAARILHMLLAAGGTPVTSATLRAAAWPQRIVAPNNLTVQMVRLRRALHPEVTVGADRDAGYSLSASVATIRWAGPGNGTATKPTASPPRRRGPAPGPDLIGRDSALADCRQSVMSAPLTTLTGPAGVGKSALARAAAIAVGDGFEDGVHWVDLVPLRDAAGLVGQIARALRQRPPLHADPAAAMSALLSGRDALLVLDNCEHLADELAALLRTVLPQTHGLRVLATSRTPLGLPEERVLSVAPLAVPEPDANLEGLSESPAGRLLLARVSAQDPTFRPSEVPTGSLVALARAVEGLPLAIELVAALTARVDLPSIATLVATSRTRLTDAQINHDSRHGALGRCVESSYQLLGASDRRLLQALSVFRGPFSREAAIALASAWSDVPSAEAVLRSLDQLERSSLVQRVPGPQERFRLMFFIRDHMWAKLSPGDAAILAQAHSTVAADRLKDAFWREMGESDATFLAQFEPEIPDFAAALEHALGPAGDPCVAAILVTHLYRLWRIAGDLDRLGRLLLGFDSDPPAGLAAADRALLRLMALYHADQVLGQPITAMAHAAILAELEQTAERGVIAYAQITGGLLLAVAGDVASATALLRQGAEGLSRLTHAGERAFLRGMLARSRSVLAGRANDKAGTLRAAKKSFRQFLALGQYAQAAVSASTLLLLTLGHGWQAEGIPFGAEALRHLERPEVPPDTRALLSLNWGCNLVAGDRPVEGIHAVMRAVARGRRGGYREHGCFRPLAIAAFKLGAYPVAALLWGYAEAHAPGSTRWWPTGVCDGLAAALAGDAATVALVAEGRSLTWDEVCTIADAMAADCGPGFVPSGGGR